MATATSNETSIEQLNTVLGREIAAVETYRIALDELPENDTGRVAMQICRKSHEDRVSKLQVKIQSLGGTPAETSGVWGTIARAIEGGAAKLGGNVAIAALEQGEDNGLKCYRGDLEKMAPEALALMKNELLPEQEQTHRLMSTLQNDYSKLSRTNP